MHLSATKRRLFWHGMLIFIFGLLAGAVVPVLVNPRMGLAAHVGAVLSGTFLIVVGLIWDEINLSPAASRAAFGLFLYAYHTGWLAQFLAGLFGTSRGMSVGGAGFHGAPWQENFVFYLALSFSAAILLACSLAQWGLGRSARSVRAD